METLRILQSTQSWSFSRSAIQSMQYSQQGNLCDLILIPGCFAVSWHSLHFAMAEVVRHYSALSIAQQLQCSLPRCWDVLLDDFASPIWIRINFSERIEVRLDENIENSKIYEILATVTFSWQLPEQYLVSHVKQRRKAIRSQPTHWERCSWKK